MCKFFVITALILSSLMCGAAYAQSDSIPVCTASYLDADGDGFGWTGSESCRVTEQSHPPPTYNDLETGATVELVRAYWDPNSDIADRNIRCEFFEFNSEAAVYERNPDAFGEFPEVVWIRDNVFYHVPLASIDQQRIPQYALWNTMFHRDWQSIPAELASDDTPIEDLYPIAFDEDYRLLWITGRGKPPLWTVTDGVYQGYSPLANSPYVEIIDFANRTDNAVRIWSWQPECASQDCSVQPNMSYHICHALDERLLVPTGVPGVNGTALDTLDENIILKIGEPDSEPADIINRETGQPVEFITKPWNYNKAIAGHEVSCTQYVFEADSATYEPNNLDLSNWMSRYIFHPYHGGDSVLMSSTFPANEYPGWWYTEKVPLQNGNLGATWILSNTMEKTADGFNAWYNEDQYEKCSASVGFAPLVTADVPDQVGQTEDPTGNSNANDTQTYDENNSETSDPSNPLTTEDHSVATNSGGGGAMSFVWFFVLLWLLFSLNSSRFTLTNRTRCT